MTRRRRKNPEARNGLPAESMMADHWRRCSPDHLGGTWYSIQVVDPDGTWSKVAHVGMIGVIVDRALEVGATKIAIRYYGEDKPPLDALIGGDGYEIP